MERERGMEREGGRKREWEREREIDTLLQSFRDTNLRQRSTDIRCHGGKKYYSWCCS